LSSQNIVQFITLIVCAILISIVLRSGQDRLKKLFLVYLVASVGWSFTSFMTHYELPAGQLKKQSRYEIARTIKALPLSVMRTRSIEEATVTRGGVDIAELNPKTMESKICPGLFFAGEVIDVDGPCGGYNLQICWSTGALAGACAAKKSCDNI